MDQHVVELGKKYLCFPKGYERKIVAKVVAKTKKDVMLQVEKYEGLDFERIASNEGCLLVPYDCIIGPEQERYFFS